MPNSLLFCTLAQLVLERPARHRRLSEMGLDFCCAGRKTLSQACAEGKLDAAAAARSLMEIQPQSWDMMDALRCIADHIDTLHHAYVRRAMPRLHVMAQELPADPRRAKLGELIDHLSGELMQHLLDEERTVFVFARSGGGTAPDARMSAQIQQMIQEHDHSGHELERIRHLTEDYAVGPDATAEYRALMLALRELDSDLHKHIYEENNLLFPLALLAAARMR